MANLQGHSEQTISASPERVWEVIEDSSLLDQWVPAVERVTEHAAREEPGSVRRCEVALGGRRGYVVERCIESVPQHRLRHAVDDDSLGFTKMFRDYTFTLELEPSGEDSTTVTCETFYEPRGILARVMNAALMRRRFAGVREGLLSGLRELVERSSVREAEAPRGTT
jgi:uncharacterized protein YndB with AHSA1/START domain